VISLRKSVNFVKKAAMIVADQSYREGIMYKSCAKPIGIGSWK
jgi:hypothetical protein